MTAGDHRKRHHGGAHCAHDSGEQFFYSHFLSFLSIKTSTLHFSTLKEKNQAIGLIFH
jgi:hypothetical protein